MNNCAAGLMVRFFKVTISTGTRISGCLTGRTFNSGRLALNAEEKIEMKRLLASRPIRTSKGSAITVARG
jgi:hypothetical protein